MGEPFVRILGVRCFFKRTIEVLDSFGVESKIVQEIADICEDPTLTAVRKIISLSILL